MAKDTVITTDGIHKPPKVFNWAGQLVDQNEPYNGRQENQANDSHKAKRIANLQLARARKQAKRLLGLSPSQSPNSGTASAGKESRV